MSEHPLLQQLRDRRKRHTKWYRIVEVERPVDWEHSEARLEVCKDRFDAGNALALHDALLRCEAAELPIPQWLAEALKNVLRLSFDGDIKGQRGKGNSFLGKTRKGRIAYSRALAVKFIRGVQADRRAWPSLYLPIRQRFLAAEIDDFGSTEEDAFDVASLALRGTIARGAPSTMRKAYRQVSQNWDDFSKFVNGYETEIILDFGQQTKLSECIFRTESPTGKRVNP
jgi:hypothetical protein